MFKFHYKFIKIKHELLEFHININFPLGLYRNKFWTLSKSCSGQWTVVSWTVVFISLIYNRYRGYK